MKLSPYRIQKTEKLKRKALALYKEGLSMREVAKIIGRSHQWVAIILDKKLSTGKHLTKLDKG